MLLPEEINILKNAISKIDMTDSLDLGELCQYIKQSANNTILPSIQKELQKFLQENQVLVTNYDALDTIDSKLKQTIHEHNNAVQSFLSNISVYDMEQQFHQFMQKGDLQGLFKAIQARQIILPPSHPVISKRNINYEYAVDYALKHNLENALEYLCAFAKPTETGLQYIDKKWLMRFYNIKSDELPTRQFFNAIRSGNIKLVELMLTYYPDLRIARDENQFPGEAVLSLINSPKYQEMKLLLQKFNINVPDKKTEGITEEELSKTHFTFKDRYNTTSIIPKPLIGIDPNLEYFQATSSKLPTANKTSISWELIARNTHTIGNKPQNLVDNYFLAIDLTNLEFPIIVHASSEEQGIAEALKTGKFPMIEYAPFFAVSLIDSNTPTIMSTTSSKGFYVNFILEVPPKAISFASSHDIQSPTAASSSHMKLNFLQEFQTRKKN